MSIKGNHFQFKTIRLLALTNMMEDRLDEFAVKQGERVFSEKIFEEGKNQVGLGDYQVRKWGGFHKHMTICFIGL
ncbi:MAG: hypothetical protein ACQETL_15540 [Bacteroidota bacterium]